MEKKYFLKLLSQKLANTISDADHEQLKQAIEQNGHYKQLSDQIIQYFKTEKKTIPAENQLERTWAMISKAERGAYEYSFNFEDRSNLSLSYAYFFKIASVLTLFIVLGFLSYYWSNQKNGFNHIYTTNQKMFKVLDDGTKIWLNKQSSVRYSKTFGKKKREIFLEGEAYFDVVKNKAVPLFIHVGNIDIEVKGTAFNVNAYKENSSIQVSLVRGLIQVTDKADTAHKILLKPSEKLIFPLKKTDRIGNNDFVVAIIGPKLLLKETKWTADTLLFNKEMLKVLALRMEKKYDVKIEIKSEQLKEKRFSGTFTSETIEQALEALKISYPLNYTINNRLVVIKD